MMFIDGGTVEKIPGMSFIDKKQEDVLVLRIGEEPSETYKVINSLLDFITIVLNSVFYSRTDYTMYKNTINFGLSMSETVNFKMSFEDKMKLFALGFNQKIILL